MKRYFLHIAMAILMAIPVCVSGQSKKEIKNLMESFNNYEVTTVKVAVDGTKFVKVWGYGKKVDDAIVQAKKNAVHASLFRGLPGMESAMATPPIFKDPNAFDSNKDYFINFFFTGGEYIKYINVTTDGVPSGQDRRQVKGGYKVALYVQVMYDNLRDRMEADGLVKKLNSGF
jgi:uncharacterized Fe-S cluster-containing radical SAM superfamily enzyme